MQNKDDNKNSGGRPPLPEGEALTVRFGLWMHEDEKIKFAAFAKRQGWSLGYFLRLAAKDFIEKDGSSKKCEIFWELYT